MFQSTVILSPLPDFSAESIKCTFMPDRAITSDLVARSALARIDDLRALGAVVLSIEALGDHHEMCRAAMDHVDRMIQERTTAIGSSPLFRRWLHACGRALIEGADLAMVGHLLSFMPNYTFGHSSKLPAGLALASRNGVVETWDCSVNVASNGERSYQAIDVLPQSRIAVRNDLPGLRVSLDESRVPERDKAVRQNDQDDRAISYPEGRFPVLQEAAAAVLKAWPEAYGDWQETLRVVVPRMPPAGWRMEGFTISSMQGAVWVNPSELLMSLESLVHEQSHVKLRYIEEAFPILESDQTGQRFPVGWRTDERPIVGIYEGVYVHIHCAFAFARCLDIGALETRYRETAAARMKELLAQASEGLDILQRHARFTEAGCSFLEWGRHSLNALKTS